eukprot:1184376-Prorocentrum_minimum.AAC.1
MAALVEGRCTSLTSSAAACGEAVSSSVCNKPCEPQNRDEKVKNTTSVCLQGVLYIGRSEEDKTLGPQP